MTCWFTRDSGHWLITWSIFGWNPVIFDCWNYESIRFRIDVDPIIESDWLLSIQLTKLVVECGYLTSVDSIRLKFDWFEWVACRGQRARGNECWTRDGFDLLVIQLRRNYSWGSSNNELPAWQIDRNDALTCQYLPAGEAKRFCRTVSSRCTEVVDWHKEVKGRGKRHKQTKWRLIRIIRTQSNYHNWFV